MPSVKFQVHRKEFNSEASLLVEAVIDHHQEGMAFLGCLLRQPLNQTSSSRIEEDVPPDGRSVNDHHVGNGSIEISHNPICDHGGGLHNP